MSSYLDTPSSPLSMRSRSPSPPLGYPSPASSFLNLFSRSSSPLPNTNSQRNEMDNPRPAKRRKPNTPKERTTEHLDLQNFHTDALAKDENAQLERLMYNIRNKQKIVVIAGAGISVSAGIPDFRSSNGLFNTLKGQHNLKSSGKHLFDASVYRDDDSTTSFHSMVRDLSHMTRNAEPTPFHHLLATLAAEDRLLRLYSQNVDGIDTKMKPLATQIPLPVKGPWPRTIQLHGGLDKMVCTKCGELSKFEGYLFDGPEPPSCTACEEIDRLRTEFQGRRSHGIGKLRPRMVLYNEFNPDEDAIGAVSAADLRSRPDAVIVVGTTLKVPGIRRIAREMCQVTRGRRDGFTAWINYEPEPMGVEFKECFDLIVRGSCDDVAQFVKLPKWDDTSIGDFKSVSVEEVEMAKAKGGIKLEFPNRNFSRMQGMATPTPSPHRKDAMPLIVNDGGKQLKFVKTATEGVESEQKKTEMPPKPKPAKAKAATVGRASIKDAFTVSKALSVELSKKDGNVDTYASNKAPTAPRRPLPSSPKKSLLPSKKNPVPVKKGKQSNSKSTCAKKQSAISKAFSVSKLVPLATSTKGKGTQDIEPAVSSTMQPISPRDLRNNSETSIQLVHEQMEYESKGQQSESPYMREVEDRVQRGTISPQSVPRAMEHLID